MDAIKFCEHKILLKPERLAATTDVRQFWKAIKKVAAACGVVVGAEPGALKFNERKVMFFDTPQADLYGNSFILRKRIRMKDNLPLDHEVTFKFRNPDVAKARAVDVRSFGLGTERIKFKEEILPPKDGSFGYRSLFSHNCVLTSADIPIHRQLAKLRTDFPALGVLAAGGETPIVLVNNITITETEADTGTLDFGHGYRANSSVAVWRLDTHGAALIGELSFQAKFDDAASVAASARDRALHFYQRVQSDLSEWLAVGATKTSLIYGAAGGRE